MTVVYNPRTEEYKSLCNFAVNSKTPCTVKTWKKAVQPNPTEDNIVESAVTEEITTQNISTLGDTPHIDDGGAQ